MKMNAVVVVGLAFGDEGKGTCVDYLTRHYGAWLNVRFNGGAQAAHNVVLSDGRHHTFSQFGSGTLAGAATHLSRHVLVNPLTMMNEEKNLRDLGVVGAFHRVTIEDEALITTPYHMAANRIREMFRGGKAHGTCGMGIGETVELAEKHPDAAIRMKHIMNPVGLKERLNAVRHLLIKTLPSAPIECVHGEAKYDPRLAQESHLLSEDVESYLERFRERYRQFSDSGVSMVGRDWLTDQLDRPSGYIIFEGAQGVLLDQDFGFHPHTTWSRCNLDNVKELIGNHRQPQVLGVVRTYMTRHGAGPFPTASADVANGDKHNGHGGWQGRFRTGWLDLHLCRYAIDRLHMPMTGLCVTHAEERRVKVCDAYAADAVAESDAALAVRDGWSVGSRDGLVHPGWGPVYPSRPAPESMERIGQRLAKVRPQYRWIEGDVPEAIAEALGTKLRLVSSGRRETDKQLVRG